MLERLANIIYYFFYACGIFIFGGFVSMGLDEYKKYGSLDSLPGVAFVGLIIGVIPYIIGWCIRYVLTGKKGL